MGTHNPMRKNTNTVRRNTWAENLINSLLCSVILTEYVAIEPSVCVCVSVCLCVCVSSLQPKRMNRFWWNFPQVTPQIFTSAVFHFFEISNLITSWQPFCIFALRHSHGCNFDPIFFKFEHKVVWYMPVFAIENRQDQLINSGDKENCV